MARTRTRREQAATTKPTSTTTRPAPPPTSTLTTPPPKLDLPFRPSNAGGAPRTPSLSSSPFDTSPTSTSTPITTTAMTSRRGAASRNHTRDTTAASDAAAAQPTTRASRNLFASTLSRRHTAASTTSATSSAPTTVLQPAPSISTTRTGGIKHSYNHQFSHPNSPPPLSPSSSPPPPSDQQCPGLSVDIVARDEHGNYRLDAPAGTTSTHLLSEGYSASNPLSEIAAADMDADAAGVVGPGFFYSAQDEEREEREAENALLEEYRRQRGRSVRGDMDREMMARLKQSLVRKVETLGEDAWMFEKEEGMMGMG